ncbi:MAG: hypothetical protein GY847_41720 [Proteobacteria bacterium]|nr:hypothetical protein [Pseudomonadota bacterium]
MKISVWSSVLLMFGLLAAFSCEVTEEKIELWKSTQNGPKKLAGTVIDPEVSMDLRAKATVALVEINAWELFRELFKKMNKEDAEKVIAAVTPLLAKMVENGGSAKEKPISKPQVDAKDALFIMLDYAGGAGKTGAEKALINWCIGDYNIRAMAGQYNIKTIVKKIGPAAADGLIPLLAIDQLVIKHVAELISVVNDPKVLARASEQLASELKANVKKIKEIHLIAAAIIGGVPIGNTLLEFATNNELSAEMQRFSLRAMSESLSNKAQKLSEEQISKLFAMSENSDYDQYQREETYYVIAQAGRKEDLPKIRKLLAEKSSFWRAVGFRCILRIDGEDQLGATLKEIGRLKLTKSKADVEEIISRIASFPKLLPKVRELINDSSIFTQAIAANVLSKLGTLNDLKIVEKLTGNKTRLPKGFNHKTLGEAAAASIEAIKKRG